MSDGNYSPPGLFNLLSPAKSPYSRSQQHSIDLRWAPSQSSQHLVAAFNNLIPQEATQYAMPGNSASPKYSMPYKNVQYAAPSNFTQDFPVQDRFMSQGPSQYGSSITSDHPIHTTDSLLYNMAPGQYDGALKTTSVNMNYGPLLQLNPAPQTYQPLPGRDSHLALPVQMPPFDRGFGYHQGFNVPAPILGPQESGFHQDFLQQAHSGFQGLEIAQGPGRYIPHAQYPATRDATQVTGSFSSHNDYYQSAAGPSSYSSNLHPPHAVHSYAPLPYNVGPMEDFSSRPQIPASDVERRLSERASLQPPVNSASAFQPMKRILLGQGQVLNELRGPPPKLGKAAGPKVSKDVNCCLYIEGLHPDTDYADLFKALRGKILRTHITKPNAVHSTAAAKFGFFTRKDAVATFNFIKGGGMFIKGWKVRIVKWNWDGYTEDEVEVNAKMHSRVLIIKGPSSMMNMKYFENLFSSKIFYDLESKFEIPCNEEGMTCFEWRFGSVPNQAQAAKWIIDREPSLPHELFEASFGPDPCDV